MEDKDLTSYDLINTIPLDNSTNELAQKIIDEDNLDSIKNMTHLFNLHQAKKNVLRVLKLNALLDKVSDQMIERFTKTPDNFSNSDLLNYMQVTQSAIDRANKSLNLVDETPVIQINQVNNVVNVMDNIDLDSRNRIQEAIKAVLMKSKELEITKDEDIVLVQEEVEEEKVIPTNEGTMDILLNEEE